jgi:hypothetical protein
MTMKTTNATIDGQRVYVEAGDIWPTIPMTPEAWRSPVGRYETIAWDEYDNETQWETVGVFPASAVEVDE